MTEFELSPSEKASGLWARLHAHLQDRLAAARVRNDHIVPESETAALRGDIRTLKALIALNDDRPTADRF